MITVSFVFTFSQHYDILLHQNKSDPFFSTNFDEHVYIFSNIIVHYRDCYQHKPTELSSRDNMV